MQEALDLGGTRPKVGRVRRDVDREASAARRAGAVLSPGMLAALRDVAEQLDAAHEHIMACRSAGQAPPTGLLMATRGLFAEFRETHARIFAGGEQRDPLDALAALIGAPTMGDPTD